ncbi:interferon regulatory factor 1 isoform X1 [Equus quagga]|uniref:interferon regulatory factor 1 isoform X1 n=2 Tax=Equus quagga TaxID=89248 RepID=UPI001EE349F6|nr:interferon regulatory factor 1 isoform X1 [Equus quagga]
MQHLLPKWGMVLYRHHLSLSLDQQERATPSSRQDVRPSRAEQRPAGAVPSPDQRAQQPRDAGILCLLPAPTRNRAPRAGTAAPAAPGPSGAAAGSRRCRANMPITRMRMRPWLEMQINSNQIPGLIWINKEEMIFQIPWKHAAKHGWDINKDACLFRSWAIHTGRYKAGEKEPDPKTWKANFRCAMNSLPDIEEVKDQSRNKGSSAVRVYRMLPPLTKNQRKERKSKSSRDAKSKAKRKSCGDSSPDTFSDGLSSSTLPDDHSSYTAQSYMGQDLEIERALTPVLSSCAVSSTLPDWHMPGEIVPDSTSDLYSFQVSPMPSTSEAATDEDEEGKLTDDIMKFLEQSGWQPTNVDGKGYLLNEPGAQPPSVYEDFSCKEETEVDSHGGYIGLISSDLKNMDTSWLDSLLTPVRLPSIQAIPCAP